MLEELVTDDSGVVGVGHRVKELKRYAQHALVRITERFQHGSYESVRIKKKAELRKGDCCAETDESSYYRVCAERKKSKEREREKEKAQ